MLAVFGNAWPDARDLTVSFPSDGVRARALTNDAHGVLDQVAQRQQWEELALRAYQTWAIHADINVGLRNDYDLPFGTPGQLSGDPRFGDFRIGSIPQQSGIVASSIPFQAVAGTFSGDLMLNSNHLYQYHAWENDLPPDTMDVISGSRDLYSVLLHEAGNTLGVEDNSLEWTVMFRQYTMPRGVLTAEDISAIQAIYGARTDPYELADNNQLQLASLIGTPVGFDPTSDVIRYRGSLYQSQDVDHYEITPVAGEDNVTIRLGASGLSLLQSRIEVFDAAGALLSASDAASVVDNDHEVQLTGLSGHTKLFVKVSPLDPTDIYSVGDYHLEVDYRDQATRQADLTAGDYDSGPDSLFTHFGLSDDESAINDTIATAESLSAAELESGRRYESASAIATPGDVDYYRIQAPAAVGGRLIVHVAGVGQNRADVRVNVVDAAGVGVGTAGRLHADGTYSLEVAQPNASQEYFVRVSVDPNSAVDVGNYVAIAEFEAPSSQMNQLVQGAVSSDADEFFRWTASKTRLFRFDLSALGDQGDALRLTVYDAHTREIKLVAVTRTGVTRSALAWLTQGDYILRFTVLPLDSTTPSTIQYQLTADGVSDDQDDNDYDPDNDPDADPYYYEYYEYDYSQDPNQYYYGDPYYGSYP